MEVLDGVHVGVGTVAGWGLVRVMVAQTEAPSEEPLDECQL